MANPEVQFLVIPNMHAPGRVVFFFYFFPLFFSPPSLGRFDPSKMAQKFRDCPETGKNTPNGQKTPLSTPSNFPLQGLKTCAPSARTENLRALRVGFGQFEAPGTEKLRFLEPHGRFFRKNLRKS